MNYIFANYLKALAIPSEVIVKMLISLENHVSYGSLRSLTDTLDNYSIANNAEIQDIEWIKTIQVPIICHYKQAEQSFILVLKVDENHILFLTEIGEVNHISIVDFQKYWEGIVLYAETDSLARVKYRETAFNNYEVDNITLMQRLKFASSNVDEPPVYKIFRKISIYLSYLFVKLNLSPNLISTIWLFILLTAAYLFSINENIIGGLLLLLHFVIDCCDGEVARVTKRTSNSGSMYEQLIHWSTNLILIGGISIGLLKTSDVQSLNILCMLCLISDSCFYFLYTQLNYWLRSEVDYGLFHIVTKLIYHIMPLNIIIYVIGSFSNLMLYSIIAWTIISFSLFLILSILFFSKEFKT